MKPKVSVFIPTWNAGPELRDLLEILEAQEGVEVEILVTDSESDDGVTRAILEEKQIDFETIPRRDFNHGRVRNTAARRASGDHIAFLSQDALPLGRDYLGRLLEAQSDVQVWASFAAQIPRADAHPFQLLNLDRHMSEADHTQIRRPLDLEEWRALDPADRVARIRFDDVASLIRRDRLLARPFEERSFGEDLAWSRRALLSGGAIAFCPAAVVRHSHAVDLREFRTRTAEVHELLRELCDFLPMHSRAILARRILGTSWRFLRAAFLRGEVPGWKRPFIALSAPFWALIQMQAMWRGSRRVVYREPS